MENTEEIQEVEKNPVLIVTEDMRSYIYQTAKWANFLAIVGFIASALMVLTAFSFGTAMNNNPGFSPLLKNIGSAGLTVFFLAYALMIFYPSFLMFRYSAQAKLGVLYAEQASLNEAMAKMKSLFKFWGILTIIFICLYIFMIVFAIGTATMLGH